jgi:dihydroorotase
MPNTKPRIDAAEIARFVVERGKTAGLARVFPIGAVSIGLLGKEMAPLSELVAAGCVAFSDDGEPVWDAGLMRRALEWCLMHGTPITCHEEDKALTAGGAMNESPLSMRLGIPGMPKAGEDVLVARDIELARLTGGRVHLCHMSTARSVELLRRAKQDGIPVTGEVAPHHLTLTEDAIGLYDTNAKMSPPLREQEDVDALRRGLADGTIDCIASDHAPHEADSKQVEFTKASFGILGLQTTLPLILGLVEEGVLTRSRAIDAMTRAAARCFNIDTGKAPLGGLSVGCAADVTIIDPTAEWTLTPEVIASKSKNTPYMGRTMRGKACTVIVGGNVVVEQGRLV